MAETSASGAMRTVIEDPVVRVALRELDRKLRERFGREYLRLILFGSRARGDSKPDSDADVRRGLARTHRQSLVSKTPDHPGHIPDPLGNWALYPGLAAGGARTRRPRHI